MTETEKKALTPREPWWGENVSAAVYRDMSASLAKQADARFMEDVLLYTTRQYPCGCKANGFGDVPNYCSAHGDLSPVADAAQPDIKADFDKAHAVVVKFGLIGVSLVAGWILAKIF